MSAPDFHDPCTQEPGDPLWTAGRTTRSPALARERWCGLTSRMGAGGFGRPLNYNAFFGRDMTMKNSHAKRNLCRLVILCMVLFALAALSSARTMSTAVNIVNNSNKEIRNVYLSHVNVDDWSGNQLGSAVIPPGQSFTLSNVACDQQQVKVIAEEPGRLLPFNGRLLRR